MTNTKYPTVLWAQRADKVYVSIQLEDVIEEKIEVDSCKLSFSGESHSEQYAMHLDFYEPIIPEESKQKKGGREYYFELKKKVPGGPFWPRLVSSSGKHHNIKIDFNRWLDEDDLDDESGGGGGGGGGYDESSLEDMMKHMGTGTGDGAGAFDPGENLDSEDSDDDDIPALEESTT